MTPDINPAIARISRSLNIDLQDLVNKLIDKDRFIKQCEAFSSSVEMIEPLKFCTHLRNNGFPLAAKVICQYFIKTNPGALSRTLAT